MRNERRRRPRVEEPPPPFAGLHSLDGDKHGIRLAIYGVAATLHPIDQSAEEETELVPWPEGADSPILVDRFDARLLLDPLELISRPSRRTDHDTYFLATTAAALEAELDEERWRDLMPSQEIILDSPNASEHSSDAERKGAPGGAYSAVHFGYYEDDGSTYGSTHNWDHAIPPPPPPLPKNPPCGQQKEKSIVTSESLVSIIGEQLPFTPAQFAIMQRSADFLKHTGEVGATMLRKQAEKDTTFAFMNPGHVWNEFFQGLMERLPDEGSFMPPPPSSSFQQHRENNDIIQRTASINSGGALGALLVDYGSDGEEEKEEIKAENVESLQNKVDIDVSFKQIDALIARLVEATQHGGAGLARKAREELLNDPAFQFLDPQSEHHERFKSALEAAQTLPEESLDAWLGKKPPNSKLNLKSSPELNPLPVSSSLAGEVPLTSLPPLETLPEGAEVNDMPTAAAVATDITLVPEFSEKSAAAGLQVVATTAPVSGSILLGNFPFPVPIHSNSNTMNGSATVSNAQAVEGMPPWIIDRMKEPEVGGAGSINTSSQPMSVRIEDATTIGTARAGGAGEELSPSALPPQQLPGVPEDAKAAEEAKKAERKKKVRMLLQRQQQLAEERRQGQAAAMQQAEEQRNKHLAAISVHKRMFLSDDDD